MPVTPDAEPEKRSKTGRPAAGWRRYRFELWTTAARAVLLPLRALISAPRMHFRTRLEPAAGLPMARTFVSDRGYDWKALIDVIKSQDGEAHHPDTARPQGPTLRR